MKQYVKITGPMGGCDWEEAETDGFNKTDKFEVNKIDEEGDYFVFAPNGLSWYFPPSSVELLEEPTEDTEATDSNPLANVPTFTEDELEHIKNLMHERKNGPLTICEYDLSILAKLTPTPTKQPWGQAEFLTQLAEWGTIEGVEVKVNGEWKKGYGLNSDGFAIILSEEPRPAFFSYITHIRINNGEPVECMK